MIKQRLGNHVRAISRWGQSLTPFRLRAILMEFVQVIQLVPCSSANKSVMLTLSARGSHADLDELCSLRVPVLEKE